MADTGTGEYADDNAEETEEDYDIYGILEDEVTEEDIESAEDKARELAREAAEGTGFHAQWGQDDIQRHLDARAEARKRREAGLTSDRMLAYAEKLYDISEGRRKTEGQIEAEKELEVLSKAQRGRAMGYGGFNTAELLQRAGRSAQQVELGGESAIEAAAKQARMAAKDQLEQLLIAGEQRAEDRAFAMQQLAFQEEQARGSLWSNVLGGVLGALGAVIGAVATGGAAGAVVGGAIGSSMGKGAGRYAG
jgi:hypothetical protein